MKFPDKIGDLKILKKTELRCNRSVVYKCQLGDEIIHLSSQILVRIFKSDCRSYNEIVDKFRCVSKQILGESRRKINRLKDKPEYKIWNDMKGRCYNPNNKSYKRYGGRGITVDIRWLNDFHQFYKDMGPRPSDQHSIDRINVDGNYSPENCRWATPDIQVQNSTKAKLTAEQVTEMRNKYNNSSIKLKKDRISNLALEYNVAYATVEKVVLRTTWKNIK